MSGVVRSLSDQDRLDLAAKRAAEAALGDHIKRALDEQDVKERERMADVLASIRDERASWQTEIKNLHADVGAARRMQGRAEGVAGGAFVGLVVACIVGGLMISHVNNQAIGSALAAYEAGRVARQPLDLTEDVGNRKAGDWYGRPVEPRP